MLSQPKSLNTRDALERRCQMLSKPHIAPLTEFVGSLKAELGPETGVPYFDPMDGGVNARMLWVLETPGPKAVGTNFVSRDNPDDTARNTFNVLRDHGIAREDTVLWNVVPWNISTEDKNKNPRTAETRKGIPYLMRLIRILPKLEAVVLCGSHAKKAAGKIRRETDLKVFETFHPAPLAYNRSHLREHLHATLEDVAAFLYQSNPAHIKTARTETPHNPPVEKKPMEQKPTSYTVEQHLAKADNTCRKIFHELRAQIMELHPAISEKAVKKLVGFRARRNFAEIHFQSNALKIHLRPKDYIDPERRVEKLDNPGFTMDRRVYCSSEGDVPYIMSLIRQSYNDVAFD